MDEVDYQTLFNIAVILAGFFGGWTLKRIYNAIDRLDTDVRGMPMTYVTKSDYKDDIKEVKQMLRDIANKIDSKEDKKPNGHLV